MKNRNSDAWPRIRRRTRKTKLGREVTDWIIDCGKVDGKRKRFVRATLAEAKSYAIVLRTDREIMGQIALALTPAQRIEAAQCFQELNGTGYSLTGAVHCFLELRKSPAIAPKDITAISLEMEAAAMSHKLRPRSLQSMLGWHHRFCVPFGRMIPADITTKQIDTWLYALALPSATSKNNALRYVSAIFAYAIKKGYAATNPVSAIERPHIERKTPEFLPVGEVAAIMAFARENHTEWVGRLALGFFAGIRSAELDRLDYAQVRIEARTVRILPEVSKTGIARIITMSENLAAWLTDIDPYHEASGRIGKMVFLHPDGKTLPPNAMRHTFATYHLAMYQDAAATSLQLGHQGDSRLLFRHYAGLATRREAQEYWEIRP